MIALLVAAVLAIDPAEADAIAARLVGQKFTIAEDHRSIAIEDIAGLGPPAIGVVERRGDELYLGEHRLTGPLARPRLAGPGYTIWVIGHVAADGSIAIERLGVLRRPR